MHAEGTCWLCGRWAKLTREHIPPRAAFNDRPLLLYEVERNSAHIGHLAWAERRESGLIVVSLCGDCNTWCGGQYGSHYVEFIRKIAEPVERARDGDRIFVASIQRPLSVLKGIMQSFISANGPSFVHANPWVRKFIKSSRNREWPPDVRLYAFATNSRGGRKSGVAGFYEINLRRARVVAEFTFWPLGTVLSFGEELGDPRLAPIHHWSQYDYAYPGNVDLQVTVNPVSTAYPLDFRNTEQVHRETQEAAASPLASRSAVEDMAKRVTEQSGETDKGSWRLMVRRVPQLSE